MIKSKTTSLDYALYILFGCRRNKIFTELHEIQKKMESDHNIKMITILNERNSRLKEAIKDVTQEGTRRKILLANQK